MTAILKTERVSVSYGKISAVRDVSFSVQPGQIVTIIGPNGAGKTTLLKAIMGMERCTGRIVFDGHDVGSLDVEERAEAGLSLVPETRELFTRMSVADNLLLGAYPHRARKAQIASDLEAIYARFPRLLERRNQMAGTLSGGERQMLALGRALMLRPKLLMLDEPSLGLAPLIVAEIFRIISSLRSTGVSVLLVEQNARAALATADYAHVLETGDMVREGRGRELLADPAIAAIYLGGRQPIIAQGAPAPSPDSDLNKG